jgi:hypothetical protein
VLDLPADLPDALKDHYQLERQLGRGGMALPAAAGGGLSLRQAEQVASALSGGAPRIVLRFDDPARPWHRYGFRGFRDRIYFTVGDRQSDIWVAELAP